MFHNEGQRFAENQCECLANRATNYSQVSKLKSAVDTDFFFLANERLVACRRILKYSYCLLYYKLQHQDSTEQDAENNLKIEEGMDCPSDNALSVDLPLPLALFLDHQERLERLTERLSYLSENALTPDDRQRVVEMVSFIDFRDVLLTHVTICQSDCGVCSFISPWRNRLGQLTNAFMP